MSDRPGPKPSILLPACRMDKNGLSFHTVGDKYVRAVAEAAEAFPFMLPSLFGLIDPADALDRVDGVLLTGSPSNVHPDEYGGRNDPRAEPYDTWRDRVTLPLIRAAIDRGIPLFAICRGMQELNVALGGTLHPRVHELDGRLDHRRPQSDDLDVQYAPRHPITVEADGMLARVLDTRELWVNSLHWQAIAAPAPALRVEALAEDGTVEAVSMPGARGFVMGVQWHPEYKAIDNVHSMRLFQAFGQASREWARLRQNAARAH